MTYDPLRHRRRSIRLKGYDYTQPGAYFVTVCTQDRACLLGEVVDDQMRLNDIGRIVLEEWFRSSKIRKEIELCSDEFVVMPNHIHGIVWIVKHDDAGTINAGMSDVGATGRSPLQTPGGRSSQHRPCGPTPRSLASFVAGFKSVATKRINEYRGTPVAVVWQRGFYEHIIRNEESLNRIRQYILDNPMRWAFDRENPVVRATGRSPLPDEP
jgi:REP element-mobilizing transposase RayT